MKKKLALLLCVVLTLGLFVGCKGDKPINTVDTSNTSDTSSKIETETVLDDKYANSEKPFSEYTLEEFEKLDISDKYVMADVNPKFSSTISHKSFSEYAMNSVCILNEDYISEDTVKILFELKEFGKDKVYEAIKTLDDNEKMSNLRPMGNKQIAKVRLTDNEKNNLKFDEDNTNLKKPYYEYTEEEFSSTGFENDVISIVIHEKFRGRIFTREDFPEVNMHAMSISYYEFNDVSLVNINVYLSEESDSVILSTMRELRNNGFSLTSRPGAGGYSLD